MSKFLSSLALVLAGVTSFVLGGAVVYLTWQPPSRPVAEQMQPRSTAVSESKTEAKSEPKTGVAEVKTEEKPEPKAEPKPEPKPAAKLEPKPEPKARPETSPEPKWDARAPEAQRRSYGIGREATSQEIAGWDIDVRPDGQGLPPGSGSAKQGEAIYMAKCAACHGEFGEGAGRWPPIAGGKGTLSSDDPSKTVGSYFPYLSSVFDYVRHTMPFGDAQSMTNDELYAVVAHVLFLNDLVEESFVLSKETWATVKMPNRAGFIADDRETTEKSFWNPAPCMSNCKSEVKIIGRARVIDVTPEEKPPAGGAK